MWRSTSATGTPRVVITTWRSTNSQLVRLAEASVMAPPDEVWDVTALFQCTVASMTTDVPSTLRAAWAVGSVAGGAAPAVGVTAFFTGAPRAGPNQMVLR